jgi:hypothetical protein
MSITNREIDQAFSDLKGTIPSAVREDFFGLLYLEREFKLPRDRALTQVAFGGNDYGIDGFHLDAERRNLYLLQFKWSTSYASFKPSFQRLIDDGMKFVFACDGQDQKLNPVQRRAGRRRAQPGLGRPAGEPGGQAVLPRPVFRPPCVSRD